jgi:hypothetical protein
MLARLDVKIEIECMAKTFSMAGIKRMRESFSIETRVQCASHRDVA